MIDLSSVKKIGILDIGFSDSALFNEVEAIIETEDVTEYEEITYKRRKKKNSVNKKSNLIKVVVEHTVNDSECNCDCCGNKLTDIGHKEVRTYNYIPSKIEILIHNEHSYKCENCEKETGNSVIKTAKRNTAFPKCMIENNVASHVIVKKYFEHVPLYRQEKILRNKGLEVSRADLSNWMIKSAEVLKPIYNLLYKNLLNNDIFNLRLQ